MRSGPATVGAAHLWPKEAGACDERGFLEFDHIVPFAAGGDATVENLRLLCRVHNRHEAELSSGRTLCARLLRRTCAQIHKLGPDRVHTRPLSRREIPTGSRPGRAAVSTEAVLLGM